MDEDIITVGPTLYISGQLGLHPDTLALVPGGIVPETRRALENLKAVLKTTGATIKDLTRVTILLNDIADFEVVNRITEEFFAAELDKRVNGQNGANSKNPHGRGGQLPARATYQVSSLPKDGQIEIEAVAVVGAFHVGTVFQCQ